MGQRVARFLLWGGLAAFLVGTASCGVGCLGAMDSAFNNNPDSESLTGGITFGAAVVAISLLMVIVGAMIKAVSKTPREE